MYHLCPDPVTPQAPSQRRTVCNFTTATIFLGVFFKSHCTCEEDIYLLHRKEELFLYLVITRKVEKIMKKRFRAAWTPVGVVQVTTYTERTPLLALGRSRRPGCTSQPRQVPHKELTFVEEEAKEVSQEEVGATFP